MNLVVVCLGVNCLMNLCAHMDKGDMHTLLLHPVYKVSPNIHHIKFHVIYFWYSIQFN
jgi:hypothetical protein